MESICIRLLGGFQAFINQKECDNFATEKARALLAYLVVEQGHPHSRESLASLLWSEQSEERARQNLRQALLHVRQALGDAASCIEINTHSVMLQTDGIDCDANQLIHLAAEMRIHRHRNVRQCYSCLRRQMEIAELYTGEFLQGFSISKSEPFEEWVLLTREHLHQITMQALEYLAGYYETRGEIEQALYHARRLTRMEPWREETHRQLMRLLVCDGQYSAALAQYKTCQEIMAREFAAEPTRETTNLFQTILNGNGADCIKNVSVLHRPFGDFPLIGRAQEFQEIADRLSDPSCRLLTLIGPGGTGKTSLAVHLAREFHGLYPDGIIFLSLVAIHTMDELLLLLLESLGAPLPGNDSPLAALTLALKTKKLLLILDNFENVVEQSAVLSELLTLAPAIQILTTSREQLMLREEWLYHVAGLYLPPVDVTPKNAGSTDALNFFANRARQLNHQFQITDENLPALMSICQLLEGSPLGIELSVVSAMQHGCETVAAALKRTLDSVSGSYRNPTYRHQSLRAVFEQSWNLLNDSEQTHLAMLAVFSDHFSMDAAATVTAIQPVQLKTLMAKSLLREMDVNRYGFHAVIHEFAQEKLLQDPVNNTVIHRKHTQYFASLCRQFMEQTIDFETFLPEKNHIIQAWRWCLEQDEPPDFAALLVEGISNIYYRRGPLPEGLELFAESYQILQEKPACFEALPILLQFKRVFLLGTQGRFEDALSILDTISTGHSIPADAASHLQYLYHKGRILAMQGESLDARPLLEEALHLAERLDQAEEIANCQRELGNVAMREGDSLQGRQYYLPALAYFQQSRNRGGECSLTNNIGISYWDTGELDMAVQWLEKALHLYRSQNDLRGESKALINLSNVMADRGLISESIEYLHSALTILQQIGNRSSQGSAYMNLGSIFLYLGQYTEAEQKYQAALEIFIESGNRQAQAETLGNLGLLAGLQNNHSLALDHLQQAETLSLECGDTINASNVLFFRARIEKDIHRYDDAKQHLEKCIEFRQLVPHAVRELETTIEMAHLLLMQGVTDQAVGMISPWIEQLLSGGLPEGLEDPLRIYWMGYEILNAVSDPQAIALIRKARIHLQTLADQISDPVLKKSFMDDFITHQRIQSIPVS